jgi:hypothetical protein
LKKLSRYSAAFALVSDACMGTLGGSLKRKECITGRLADALGWMYIASATVQKYVEEGKPARDRDFFRWARARRLAGADCADGVLANLPSLPPRPRRAGMFPPRPGACGRRTTAPSAPARARCSTEAR